MKKFFLVGNWKAYGSREQLAQFLSELLEANAKTSSKQIEKILALPFPYLALSVEQCETCRALELSLAAQSVSSFHNGAYTGEVTAEMLKDLGISHAIVGHFERRTLQQESIEQIIAQISQLQTSNLRPILCFGEALQSSPEETSLKLFYELEPICKNFSPTFLESMLFAYEPYWAIGQGLSASSEQVAATLVDLKSKLEKSFQFEPKFLYGGSVNETSIVQFLESSFPFSGVLVGSASLSALRYAKLAELSQQILFPNP